MKGFTLEGIPTYLITLLFMEPGGPMPHLRKLCPDPYPRQTESSQSSQFLLL